MASITKAQLRMLWVLAKECNLDEVDLHSIVYREAGQESISTLTKAQAIEVIDALVKLKQGQTVTAAGMATEKQIKLINHLIEELGWDNNSKRLQGFVKRIAKVDNVSWLTVEAASKIIVGLKAILKQEQEKAVCKTN